MDNDSPNAAVAHNPHVMREPDSTWSVFHNSEENGSL
jgi:hypothetical protein